MEWIKKMINGLRKKSYPAYRSGWDEYSSFNSLDYLSIDSITASNSNFVSGSNKNKKEDTRIEKKPVDIYNEILQEEPKMNLSDVTGQIKIVKRRIAMLNELGTKVSDEYEALAFLEARQKIEKHKDLFHWGIATFSSVKSLCEKYKVASVSFDSYYKTMPMEAIDELEKYLNAYRKVRNDKPVMRLIIDDVPDPAHGNMSAERKKDPILLASSPFGKWWYVLGAWDKEVAIVDDLIYNGR